MQQIRHVLRPAISQTRVFTSITRQFTNRTMSPWIPNQYPTARRSDHVDLYKSETKGQVKIPDPYQWLEVNGEETERWTSEQEKFTRAHLDKNPDREKLEQEIRKNTDYAKASRFSLTPDTVDRTKYASLLHTSMVSSRPPALRTMAAGIGTIIVDCRPSQVRT